MSQYIYLSNAPGHRDHEVVVNVRTGSFAGHRNRTEYHRCRPCNAFLRVIQAGQHADGRDVVPYVERQHRPRPPKRLVLQGRQQRPAQLSPVLQQALRHV